jgi:hypothetical protein
MDDKLRDQIKPSLFISLPTLAGFAASYRYTSNRSNRIWYNVSSISFINP